MNRNEMWRTWKKEKNISNGLSKFYWYIFFSSLNGYILIKFSAFSESKLFLMLNHAKPHVEKNAPWRCWTSRAGTLTWRESAEWEWAVAYAENLHGGISLSGVWWSLVFGVPCLWRHNVTSYSCFQTNILAKFVDTISGFYGKC